jgi:bifunctional UDP-N-acetylglucosamine pyrophosphorylase/glucosamine-1-phosphate N-acetyltransferase
MKSELPKVLHHLQGKPLISHVIENIKIAGISDVIVVIGYGGESVIEAVGNSVDYVWQHKQLGTGHAVVQTESILNDFKGDLLVASGDVPLISSSTFNSLIDSARGEGVGASVLTMCVDNPTGYGRVIKDERGNLVRIVEEIDSTKEEKVIREVNTGTYIFDKNLLFSGLRTVGKDNKQGEYYLPDVLQYIIGSGHSVKTLLLEDSIEGSGVNSQEDLERLEEYLDFKSR